MAVKRRAAAATSASAESPFDDWDTQKANKFLQEMVGPDVKINQKFINGDHWQDTLGWIGPRPLPGDANSDAALDLLKQAFVSRNVIKEVCRRHRNGVLGISPRWGLVPRVSADAPAPTKPEGPVPIVPKKATTPPADPDATTTPKLSASDEKDTAPSPSDDQPESNPLVKEAEDALTEWWDLRKAHIALKNAAEQVLWGARGPVRLFIPAGLLSSTTGASGTVPKAPSLRAALRYIYVESPTVDQAGVYEDPDTRQQVGITVYKDAADKEIVELSYTQGPLLDPEKPPDTAVRIMSGKEGGTPVPMTLGGRILMYQMEREPLVTEQIRSSQKALNLDLTVIPRNITTAGFLERVLLNAQMPGHWETDETTGEKKRWVPEPYITGASTTQFVSGQEVEDQATGKTTLTTPQIQYREPISAEFAIMAKNSHYRDIVEECDQGHVLLSSQQDVSGRSREEARADYDTSMRETQITAQDCGRWMLETVLALGEFIMGAPGKYTDQLRAEFEAILDSGPPDVPQMENTIKLRDAGFISEETAMARVNVQDVTAERARRDVEPGAILTLRKKQGEALDIWTKLPGVTLEGAAEFLGLDPGDVKILTKGSLMATPPPGLGPDGQPLPPVDAEAGATGEGPPSPVPPINGKPGAPPFARPKPPFVRA